MCIAAHGFFLDRHGAWQRCAQAIQTHCTVYAVCLSIYTQQMYIWCVYINKLVHTANRHRGSRMKRSLFSQSISSQTASVCEYQGHHKMRKFFALLIPPFAMFMAVYLPRIDGKNVNNRFGCSCYVATCVDSYGLTVKVLLLFVR